MEETVAAGSKRGGRKAATTSKPRNRENASKRKAGDRASAVDERERHREDCAATTTSTASPEVKVSVFDCSVENHFKAIDAIFKLCGEEEFSVGVEDKEVVRLSSAITFLR